MAAALVLSACGSPDASTRSTSGSATLSSQSPLPAGPIPSPLATMVCKKKAQHEIAEVLGVTAVVGPRTWIDHRYSCPYEYPSGRFVLSIQELSSWSQTLDYYHGLAKQLGDSQTLPNLGQGAYQTTNGSVVVRKDWKVLVVDISHLPTPFGVPPTSASDVAVTVADVILGCWSGD